LRAEALALALDRVDESVLLQPELGQTVVAAIPAGPFAGQWRIEPGDLAGPGGQRTGLEWLLAQPAALRAQCRQLRRLARAQRRGDGVVSDPQRFHQPRNRRS
jgi:hypothetical protein